MNYKFLCVVLFTLVLNSSAASPKYYELIYKAQNYLIDGNCELGLETYCNAFDLVELPHIEDIHNAILFTEKCGLKKFEKHIIKYLKKYSLNKSYLLWLSSKIKSSSLESLIKKHKEDPISKIQVEFEELTKKDQSIRDSCKINITGSYEVDPKCTESIKRVDSMNLTYMQNLFKDSGLPNKNKFKNIGPVFSNSYTLILMHNQAWGRDPFRDELKEAVLALKITPDYACSHLSYQNENSVNAKNFGANYHAIFNDNLYIFDDIQVPNLKSEINQNRKSLYLDDLDSFLKRVKFQYENKNFKLVDYRLMETFNLSGEQGKLLEEKWKSAKVIFDN